jgi:Raf kinase inhibitor-like YbhB/YbcL family protein
MRFELKSACFRENGPIAKKYTCDGSNASVSLNWTDPPEDTRSFALIADDPDAPSGTFVHWVLYDLPGDARGVEEGIPPKRVLDNGAKQGVNDFRKIGYGGPCPPRGPAHRYVFTLYALNRVIGLEPGATKEQLLRSMKGHISAETQLIGTYAR